MARHSTVLLLAALAALVAAPAFAQPDITAAVDAALASVANAQNVASSMTSSAASQATAVASASGPYGGVDSKYCGTLLETSGTTSVNNNGCSVDQKVSACGGKLSTYAKINGKVSTCCIVMFNYEKGNLPTLFCGQPAQKGQFWQFPSDVKVSVSPSCSSNNGNNADGFTCSVTFDQLPDSYVQPPMTTPYTTNKFNPCGSGYKSFSQVSSTAKGAPVTITATCS